MSIQSLTEIKKWAAGQHGDLVAGISTATLTLPQAVAFALLAGLPVTTALWASIIPTVVAGWLGGRVELLTGPVSMLALIIGTTLSALFIPLSPDALSAAVLMTLSVGVIQMFAGFTGAVRVLEWMPQRAVKGVMGAVGLSIIASQLPSALGVTSSPMTPRWREGIAMLTAGHWLVPSAGVFFATIALIYACARAPWGWLRKLRFAVGMLASSYGALALGLNVLRIGNLGLGWPIHSLVPSANVIMAWPLLVGPVFTMAALALTQSALIARSMPARGRPDIDLRRESFAQGWANISAGLVGGMPVAASLNRSQAHEQAGAKTWWSLLWVGVGVLIITLGLRPVLSEIALSAAAGMLAVVGASLIDLRQSGTKAKLEVGAFVAIGFFLGMAWAVLGAVAWGIYSHARCAKKTSVALPALPPPVQSTPAHTVLPGAVLLAIKPKFAEQILSGEKRFEFRRTVFKRPNVGKVILYASSPIRSVVGEFDIDVVISATPDMLWQTVKHRAGIDRAEFDLYFKGKAKGHAIAVKNPVRYDSPRNIGDYGLKTPPQSFTYL